MRQPNFFSNGCLSLEIQLNGVMHNIFNLWFEKQHQSYTGLSGRLLCTANFLCQLNTVTKQTHVYKTKYNAGRSNTVVYMQ